LHSAEKFKNKITNLLEIWKGWKIFEPNYIEGLYSCLLRRKRERDELISDLIIPETVKQKLEEYEDKLLDIYTSNKDNIITLARQCGISTKGDYSEIITRLTSFEEYRLLKAIAIVSFHFYV
jgi:hypothetical protein